jgi:hypothetical protein
MLLYVLYLGGLVRQELVKVCPVIHMCHKAILHGERQRDKAAESIGYLLCTLTIILE